MSTFNFIFTNQDLEILNKALTEAPLPYKYTVQIINKINNQIAEQEDKSVDVK